MPNYEGIAFKVIISKNFDGVVFKTVMLSGAKIMDSQINSESTWSSEHLAKLLPKGEASGSIASFEDGAGDVPLISCVADFMATQAEGTPTPSAPIPIVGVDKVNITRTGNNLWDEEWELGLINDSDGQNSPNSTLIRSKNYIPVNPSATYYFNLATKNAHVFYYDQNKTYLGYINLVSNSTFTPLANTAFIRFRMNTAYGTTYNNDLSINYPATDTEYHAYTGGTTALINLGGTYYGGSVDALSGEITAPVGFFEFDGSSDESWTAYAAGNGYYIVVSDMKNQNNGDLIACNMFEQYSGISNLGIRLGFNNNVLYVYQANTLSGVTDLATWKTWLASNKLQVCYELATPATAQASNTAEIPTIVGDNQVFADSGDVAVKYFLDIKKYIDNLVNPSNTSTLSTGLNLTREAPSIPDEVEEEEEESQETNEER